MPSAKGFSGSPSQVRELLNKAEFGDGVQLAVTVKKPSGESRASYSEFLCASENVVSAVARVSGMFTLQGGEFQAPRGRPPRGKIFNTWTGVMVPKDDLSINMDVLAEKFESVEKAMKVFMESYKAYVDKEQPKSSDKGNTNKKRKVSEAQEALDALLSEDEDKTSPSLVKENSVPNTSKRVARSPGGSR